MSRAAFLVMVDLDPVPGWGHEPESWREHLESYLLSAAGHYNPVVVEFTPTDLEPMKHAAREAGATEVRARVWNVLNDLIADHPMWIGDDGQPLDYSPEREARIHDFIREASAALKGGE